MQEIDRGGSVIQVKTRSRQTIVNYWAIRGLFWWETFGYKKWAGTWKAGADGTIHPFGRPCIQMSPGPFGVMDFVVGLLPPIFLGL